MTLSLVSVSTVVAGDRKIYVVGGQQLDQEFLSSLVLPAGMRVLLYRNLEPQFSPAQLIGGRPGDLLRVRPLIEEAQKRRTAITGTVGTGVDAETFHALPLPGL